MAPATNTKKVVTWALIAALLNPALTTPWAFGRDTDIFLGITSSLATAEPNILITLDTSDSMNNYEGWREYPGGYDSHVEYLWNDPTYINTITAVAPNAALTNIGSSPSGYFTSYSGTCPDVNNAACPRDSGYFAGTTDTERAALKKAALDHANGNQSGDAGARSIYRNYNDASWIYWLPQGTAESDQRLWSFSFNRFVGGIRVSNFSSTNGTSNPVVRAGINFGVNRDFTEGGVVGSTTLRNTASALNRCVASMAELLPSTVYAPTEFGRNSGKWLNQKWARWERWQGLENSRVPQYPGTTSAAAAPLAGFPQGALGDSYTTAFPGPTEANPLAPGNTPPGVQAANPTVTAERDLTGSNGSQGLPIRLQLDTPTTGTLNGSDSHAGWTTLKADLGGFVHHSGSGAPSGVTVLSVGSLAQARLQELRTLYGYALVSSTGASALQNEQFSAWLGNRDTSTTFGVQTGTPAYFNVRGNDPTGSGTTVSCTRTCGVLQTGAVGPTSDGVDGDNTARRYFTPGTGGLYCEPNGTLPVGGCGTAPTPALCAPANIVNYTTANRTACAWSGRQSRYIEGVGTVFYGGTCSGQCFGAGFVLGGAACASGSSSAAYCNQPSAGNDGANWVGSYTIDGTSYSNVTKNNAGTCSNLSDTTANCTARKGFNCVYGPTTVASFCPNQTASTTTGAPRFPVYARSNQESNLVHDCKADESARNPSLSGPSANVFMTIQKRDFNQSFNTTVSTSGTTAAYTTSSANAFSPSTTDLPAIDLYSVNYLNWLYGPKGPNGHPIGRKTRLQIAKDALADIINITSGVRFGMLTFNSLPDNLTLRSSQGSQGGKIVYPVRRMGSGPSDSDFVNRAALINVINQQIAKAATPLSESLYEAYLYFSGRAPRFGTSSAITANFGAGALPAVGGGNVTDGADASAISGGLYVSPIMSNPTTATPSSCQKNYVIMITDGGPELDVDASTQIAALRFDNTLPPQSGRYSPNTNTDVFQPDTTTGQFETTGLPFGPPSIGDTARTDGGYVWLDELAYFMSRADMSPGAPHTASETTSDQLANTQSVITYTIGFAGANSPVLQNTADRSGGKYYIAENSAELASALNEALESIKSWNPTVAAPTVPISALNRSQNEADVYLAYFEPSLKQAWQGTVKRFRIGRAEEGECPASKPLCLIGKTVLGSGFRDIETVDSSTNQIIVDPNARSFWLPDAAPADGSEPTKGGTGHHVVNTSGFTPANRKVYTFLPSRGADVASQVSLTGATNAVSEDNSRITKARLGNAAMSDAARSTLINYIRGGNPASSDCTDTTSSTACVQWRTWAHGDVQHSRPVIVTYNSTPTPDSENPGKDRASSQFLFFLSNDGLLRAVDAATGREKWAFLVEEALPKIAAQLANNPGASLDLADGSPVAWVDRGNADGIVNGSERVWLFFGLRRGGRAYYALDVTNIDDPKFMWKLSSSYHPVSHPYYATMGSPTGSGELCTGTALCGTAAEYAQLGQSWSTPVVGRVAATTGASGARPAGNADPVVIFGGGFDTQHDFRSLATPTAPPAPPLPTALPSTSITSDYVGRALYVVEGSTGQLVRQFSAGTDFLNASTGLQWSIPSDLTVLNTDFDAQGFFDRIVVGDMGGNVWRFDIHTSDATTWRGKLLAILSDAVTPPNRKIMAPPAIAPQLAPFPVEWDAVYVGTGDREHPLVDSPLTANTSNRMFMIVDFDIGLGATNAPAANVATDFLALSNSTVTGVQANQLVTKKGWYRDLDAGELVTGPPFVVNQKLRFGTYIASIAANACLPPGQGRLNEINALYGELLPLNQAGPSAPRERFYSGVSRGYFSPLQTVILGSGVYTFGMAGPTTVTTNTPPPGGCAVTGMTFSCLEQRIGIAQRVYWYMEPEQ